jgi:hypothetical protein
MAKELTIAPGAMPIKRTVRVDLSSEEKKNVEKLVPGKKVKMLVTGEVIDLSLHKPYSDQDDHYVGGLTIEVKNLKISHSADNEVSELFEDEE